MQEVETKLIFSCFKKYFFHNSNDKDQIIKDADNKVCEEKNYKYHNIHGFDSWKVKLFVKKSYSRLNNSYGRCYTCNKEKKKPYEAEDISIR